MQPYPAIVHPPQSDRSSRKKIRISDLLDLKKKGQRIASLTCYDAAFAQLLEHTSLHFVLVGDSLGQVMQGLSSTLPVTLQDVAYHVRCVQQALATPLLVADMPFGCAGMGSAQTYANAAQLMVAGAEAVKIEGATPELLQDISFLVRHGIPVMGHIGLQPQSVHAIGGYRVQGKTKEAEEKLVAEALLLQQAGCFALVLELVVPEVAEAVSKALDIPTIGIGAGNHCDGNILVLQDMLGMNAGFKPRFLKHYAQLGQIVNQAVQSYCDDVQQQKSEP